MKTMMNIQENNLKYKYRYLHSSLSKAEQVIIFWIPLTLSTISLEMTTLLTRNLYQRSWIIQQVMS